MLGPNQLLMILFFVILISVIEALVLIRMGKVYDVKAAFIPSLADEALAIFLPFLLPFTFWSDVFNFFYSYRLFTLELNSWQQFLVLFISLEFCYYWFHRGCHGIRWFWVNHSIHHTPNQLVFAVAYRFGPFGYLLGTVIFFLPLALLGFSQTVVSSAIALNLVYQFWIHNQWMPKFGFLEYVLNTPSAHRVHHATNPEYINKNFGGVLIVFDRLFGTYVEEKSEVPCEYGLLKKQLSYNPIRVELDTAIDLAKDVWHAKTWKGRIGYLFKPPGWREPEI